MLLTSPPFSNSNVTHPSWPKRVITMVCAERRRRETIFEIGGDVCPLCERLERSFKGYCD